MNELARHIEYLLLENDCVILPDFGGFVAHYTEATYEAKTQLFMPPMRTIGFNPQLRLNDGLLTQSVMEVQGTNYGDALKTMKRWINQLKQQLYEEGSVELTNVGQLRMSIRGTIDFVPYNSRITTAWLYGLGSFEMPLLSEKLQPAVAVIRQKPASAPVHTPLSRPRQRALMPSVKELMPFVKQAMPRVSGVNLRPLVRLTPAMMQGVAAVAAVLVLFFFFSVPVKNTEVVSGSSYAQLMPSALFERIEKQSVAIHEVALPQDEKKPVVVERATLQHHKKEKKSVAKPLQQKPQAAQVASSKNASTKATSNATSANAPSIKAASTKAGQPTASSATQLGQKSKQSSVQKPAQSASLKSAQPAPQKPAQSAVQTSPSQTRVSLTSSQASVSQTLASANDYHVIVASVATEADARKMAQQLVSQGYSEARVIVRDGKNRVSLRSLPSQAAAYHAVNQLREGEKFAGAWVLHCKVK